MKPFDPPILVTKPIHPNKDRILSTISTIIDSTWLTNMGPYHEKFEKKLRQFLNVRHISVFNNGTIALITALKALDLPKNSEVITTPFTFAATPHAIAWNNLTPVFADIDTSTMTLCPKSIERAITPNTSAIIPVHVYGFPSNVVEIDQIAKKHNLRVIYDAAHAFGTTINDQPITNFGDITMLSFHATKLFNCIEGGALVYNNSALHEKIYALRNFGIKKTSLKRGIIDGIKNKDYIDAVGINGKLNEFQCAWGIETLKIVNEEQTKRHQVAEEYNKQLSCLNWITIPKIPENTTHSFQYFPILCGDNKRDSLYNLLLKHNVYSRKYFYPLCSDFQCYQSLESSNKHNLINAHRIADSVLCLPFYGELSKNNCKKIRSICDIIAQL